jgi:hypothetical protein
MKAIIAKNARLHEGTILRGMINDRGKYQFRDSIFLLSVEWPEQGVLRRYCSSGDFTIWMDDVIDESVFRR